MLLSWNLVTASFQLMVSNRQIEFGILAANAHGILSQQQILCSQKIETASHDGNQANLFQSVVYCIL